MTETLDVPRSFAEHDLPTILDFIDANPLAAIVSGSPSDGLVATHLPLVLDRAAGPMGTLVGHFARANLHSRHSMCASATRPEGCDPSSPGRSFGLSAIRPARTQTFVP